MLTTTPELRPPVVRRKMAFDFAELDTPFFYRGNPLLSTFFGALSAMFPPGERAFVRSVAHYRNAIDDEALLSDVSDFASQEAHHAHHHRAANRVLDTLGYGASECAADFDAEILRVSAGLSPERRLAATVCAEHITAVLGHLVLSRPALLDPLPAPARELLRWHAVEEIEHKAVAFDVFMSCVGDRTLLRRAMLVETALFVRVSLGFQRRMLRNLGARPTLSQRAESLRLFLGPGGVVPSIRKHYAMFFRADFHPWQIDDRELLAQWQATQTPAAA